MQAAQKPQNRCQLPRAARGYQVENFGYESNYKTHFHEQKKEPIIFASLSIIRYQFYQEPVLKCFKPLRDLMSRKGYIETGSNVESETGYTF